MLRSYLKIALRNLWRNRLFSTITILGLTVGLAVSLLIVLFVSHERTYDRFHTNADRIYRVWGTMKFGEQEINTDRTSAGFGPGLKAGAVWVEDFVRVLPDMGNVVIKTNPTRKFHEDKFVLADPSFLTVFSFPLLEGRYAGVDAKIALTRPLTVLLTERMAERYFGRENPVGKTIRYQNKLDFEVTGVLKNPPSNSTLQFDFVGSMASHPAIQRLENATMSETGATLNDPKMQFGSYRTYLLLRDPAQLPALFKTLPKLLIAAGSKTEGNTFKIDPLTGVHLGMNFDGGGSASYLTLFLIIAGLVLLLALINYMSLTTARAVDRAREVGVRKVMGAARSELAGQFYGESLLVTLVGFALALMLVQVLRPLFTQFFDLTIDADYVFGPTFLGLAVGLFVLCVLVAGSYPALLLSSFSPVSVLKGNLTKLAGGIRIRQGLTVVQVAVSVGLMACSLLIYQQAGHLQNRQLGLQKDRMLIVPLDASLANAYVPLKTQLRQLPGVERVSAASLGLYRDGTNMFFIKSPANGKEVSLHVLSVDDQFVETMNIPWVQKPAPDELTAPSTIVLNETAIRQLGLNKTHADKPLKFGDNPRRVVGVMRDFAASSVNNFDNPLALFVASDTARAMATQGGSLYIRIAPGADLPGVVAQVGDAYNAFRPEKPFEYYFLDQAFNDLYKTEVQLSTLFGFFTSFALFIACMGLFGLATFMARSRTKEIGIRKVLGATVSNLILLLSRDFARIVLLGIGLALPIAWYVMNRWLADFAYKIDINWWVFALAGGFVLLLTLLTVSVQSIRAALANPVNSLKDL
ncbi:MAG: ABC transporter permease [Cytophagales bacterium]|nr:MAG: ABC transporter permease [Cytophagales bacterium]